MLLIVRTQQKLQLADRWPEVLGRLRMSVLSCVFLFACWVQVLAQEPARQPSEQSIQAVQPLPSLLTPLAPQEKNVPYRPITNRQRLRWFLTNTIGPPHLTGGVISSAFGTALNRPVEYGPGWTGFGDRFGMRLTGVSTGNAIEASIGMIWEEDPRYFRVPNEPFKIRLRNVVKQTFYARRNDATFDPAYARFVAIVGNNVLSNTWRVQSQANIRNASVRSLEGLAGRMASNAFEEFWPDLKSYVFHHR
jgi:hypothetical protein